MQKTMTINEFNAMLKDELLSTTKQVKVVKPAEIRNAHDDNDEPRGGWW